MNKLIILAIAGIMFSSTTQAQKGAIGDKELKEIESSFKLDAKNKALMNAISNNSINLSPYVMKQVLKNRLKRLVAHGQVRYVDGRYYVAKQYLLWLDWILNLMKRILKLF